MSQSKDETEKLPDTRVLKPLELESLKGGAQPGPSSAESPPPEPLEEL